MTEISKYNINNTLPVKGENSYITDAQPTTSNLKLERPKVTSADLNVSLNNFNKYSYSESNKHLNEINKDIYQRANKEKEKHEFNFKRFFTIFGIIGLLTAAIAYFRRGK